MFFWENGLERSEWFQARAVKYDVLKIVIVRQLVASHDAPRTSE
jgi:hypothetical protein